MKSTRRTNYKKKNSLVHGTLLVIAVLYIVVLMFFPLSLAKFTVGHEYKLNLIMMPYYTFFAGETYAFEIPYDGYYSFKLWGGDGGDSKYQWGSGSEIFQLGGKGGIVTAVSYFSQGTVLFIVVGKSGEILTGGYNGGGNGETYSPSSSNYYGGGGGGATDVRLSSGELTSQLLVAGGGGGGSGGDPSPNSSTKPNAGGSGGFGHNRGADGQGTEPGLGGEMWTGGQGAQYGGFGLGGNSVYSGGGGGGGYYGGGGAYGTNGSGGGGGSSYIGDGFTDDLLSSLPEKSDYIGDSGDGFALVAFFGSTL